MSDTQNGPTPPANGLPDQTAQPPPASAPWPPAPPGYQDSLEPAAVRPIFLPISSLSRWVVALIIVSGVLNTIIAATESDVTNNPSSLLLPVLFLLIAFLFVVDQLACAVCFLVWVYRTYSNLKALGSGGLSSSRGWAVVYYFIPILFLYKPCQLMIETWKASDPGAVASGNSLGWRTSRSSPLIGIWWAVWLISNFISALVASSALQQTRPHIDTEGNTVSCCANVLSCIAASFLVIALTRRQEEAARRLTG